MPLITSKLTYRNKHFDFHNTVIKLGKSRSYVNRLSKTSKWSFFEMLDADLLQASQKYDQICFELVEKLTDLSYFLQEKKINIKNFSRLLHEKKIFSNPNSFAVRIYTLQQCYQQQISVEAYSKYALILHYAERYLGYRDNWRDGDPS